MDMLLDLVGCNACAHQITQFITTDILFKQVFTHKNSVS